MKEIIWGLLIPFIGTTLGAGMVFLMKNKMLSHTRKVRNNDYKVHVLSSSCMV